MSLSASPLPKPTSTIPYLSLAIRTLLLGFAVTLSACGGSDDETSSTIPEVPSEPSTPDIEADTNWSPAGGAATITSDISRPFLQVIPTLPTSSLGNISADRELFIIQWTPAGEGRILFDGVGPLFNANACTQCHSSEGRKPVYALNGELSDAIFLDLAMSKEQLTLIMANKCMIKV